MNCYLNGIIMPSAEASIGLHDLGLLRGFGIFDYLQQKQGVPLFIDDYLNRFFNSAAIMGVEIPVSRAEIKASALALIKSNGLSHSGLRLILTGGYSPDSFTPTTPNFYMLEQPLQMPDNELFTNGVKLMWHQYTREVAEVKTTNYVVPILLQAQWKAMGAYDVLYHDEHFVTESSRSNFFIVSKDNILITPDRNVLKGITRKKVLELAMNIMGVEIRDVKLSQVTDAKEAFITSSTKGVLPIVQINDLIIADGRVGEWSMRLMQDFDKLQTDYLIKNAI